MCDKSIHGEEMLVKDRENKEKLIICSDDDGVYLWKATDGRYLPA